MTHHHQFEAVIVGAGGAGLMAADSARFRQQLAAAGLSEAVIDAGWVELAALPATLAAADVGLYLMDDTLLNRAKCPVKLADMLAAGVPVVANVSARPISTPDEIRAELKAQLTAPVRWTDSVRALSAAGVDAYVEVGPGDVLLGLVKRIDRDARRTKFELEPGS